MTAEQRSEAPVEETEITPAAPVDENDAISEASSRVIAHGIAGALGSLLGISPENIRVFTEDDGVDVVEFEGERNGTASRIKRIADFFGGKYDDIEDEDDDAEPYNPFNTPPLPDMSRYITLDDGRMIWRGTLTDEQYYALPEVWERLRVTRTIHYQPTSSNAVHDVLVQATEVANRGFTVHGPVIQGDSTHFIADRVEREWSTDDGKSWSDKRPEELCLSCGGLDVDRNPTVRVTPKPTTNVVMLLSDVLQLPLADGSKGGYVPGFVTEGQGGW